MMRSTCVVLVDSQPIFRAGLRRVLEETGRFQVVAEAGTVLEASQLGETRDFDLIVLNAHLPVMVGIHVARLLARRQATPHIVFLGNDQDRDTVAATTRVGAAVVLPRDTSPAELVRVLNRVVADGDSRSATPDQAAARAGQGESRQRPARRPPGGNDPAPARRPSRRPTTSGGPGTATPPTT